MQEGLNVTRLVTTRAEVGADEDGRGGSSLHQHIRMWWGVWGENKGTRDRFALSGRAVHPRYALITDEGAVGEGGDRFGTEVTGEAKRAESGCTLRGRIPTGATRGVDGVVSRGGGHQRGISRVWKDVPVRAM